MTNPNPEKLSSLQALLSNLNAVEQLKLLAEQFKGKIAFSTSFGEEDQVITDLIFANHIPITVFTLDTGRFFPETYKVWSKTLQKYNKPIVPYFPVKEKVEEMLLKKGPFSFYNSLEDRKECCTIRKVAPLKRALADIECWVTGLRAGQSGARIDLNVFTWDNGYDLFKFNPVLNWSLNEVQGHINSNNIPKNSLHEQGFVSIGCQPCTRAIAATDDIRAGRWWWEDNSKKECGLHAK